MACRRKRRNCPCDPRWWTPKGVAARFEAVMAAEFDTTSVFWKIEKLFPPSR